MLVFRIAERRYTGSLFASGKDGRWNSGGRKVIYAGATVEICFMEHMVRRQGVGFGSNFSTMIIEVPDSLGISEVDPKTLHGGWRNPMDYSKCQLLGNNWFDSMSTPLLKVPSAVLIEASNFLIHTKHPDFGSIKLIEVTELVPDERIEDILRRYRK